MPIYERVNASGKKVYDARANVGHNQYMKRGFTRKGDATAWIDTMRRTGKGSNPNMKFEEMADRWMREIKSKRADNTVALYRHMLDKHIIPRLGEMRLRRISPLDVQDLVDTLEKKPRTANQCLVVIRAVYRQANAWGLIDSNPATAIARKPEDTKEAVFISHEEARLLLDACEGQDRLLLLLAMDSGMRSIELRGLRWDDIDGRRIKVLKSKTAAGVREVVVTQGMADALQAARELKTSYIFTRADGVTPLGRYDIRRILNKAVKKAGLEEEDKDKRITPHSLRHSYAGWMVTSGESIKNVADQLGHSTASFTMNKYAHFSDDQREAAADRFEKIVSLSYQSHSKQDAEVVDIHR